MHTKQYNINMYINKSAAFAKKIIYFTQKNDFSVFFLLIGKIKTYRAIILQGKYFSHKQQITYRSQPATHKQNKTNPTSKKWWVPDVVNGYLGTSR